MRENYFLFKAIQKILKISTRRNSERKIFFGKLKGYKWIYSVGYSSYWMGTYEKIITDLFEKFIKDNMVIYDIGANIGYYTLIASKLVGANGKVYAFEPFPKNILYLRKHININKIKNVEIFEKAVSNFVGKAKFSNGDNIVANTLCSDSPIFQNEKLIEVDSISLDYLIENGEIFPPELIKMDIEGAEYDALLGSFNILSKYHPIIFLSTHNCQNTGVHRKCLDLLTNLGYKISYLDFYKKETENDDPWYEIVAEYNK